MKRRSAQNMYMQRRSAIHVATKRSEHVHVATKRYPFFVFVSLVVVFSLSVLLSFFPFFM